MRDAEQQHWHLVVDEELLCHSARAAVTLFDDLLQRVFGEHLSKYIPQQGASDQRRGTHGAGPLDGQGVQAHRRLAEAGAAAEAKARVRALLATEAIADADAAEMREDDVRRVTKGIRDGETQEQVFPKLTGYTSAIQGDGVAVEVRIVKVGGLSVTYTKDPDAATATAAIRTVDLEKKFHMGAYDLADKAGVDRTRAVALRRHLTSIHRPAGRLSASEHENALAWQEPVGP